MHFFVAKYKSFNITNLFYYKPIWSWHYENWNQIQKNKVKNQKLHPTPGRIEIITMFRDAIATYQWLRIVICFVGDVIILVVWVIVICISVWFTDIVAWVDYIEIVFIHQLAQIVRVFFAPIKFINPNRRF